MQLARKYIRRWCCARARWVYKKKRKKKKEKKGGKRKIKRGEVVKTSEDVKDSAAHSSSSKIEIPRASWRIGRAAKKDEEEDELGECNLATLRAAAAATRGRLANKNAGEKEKERERIN